MNVEEVKKEFIALGIPREEIEYAFNVKFCFLTELHLICFRQHTLNNIMDN